MMQVNVNNAIEMLPRLLDGLLVSVQLLIPTFVLGMVLSIPLALATRSQSGLLRHGVTWYTALMRGSPQLVLLYLVYNGFPKLDFVRHSFLWPFFREPVYCAIFVFVLNHAAFLAEIWRGALGNVPVGITEASNALGVSRWRTFFNIELPLAFRLGLPAYRNEVILFIKATAVVSAITIFDLLGVANDEINQTYDPFTPLVMAGVIYWIVIQVVQIAFDLVIARLSLDRTYQTARPRAAKAAPTEG